MLRLGVALCACEEFPKAYGELLCAADQPFAGELLLGRVLLEQLLAEHSVYDRRREARPLAAQRLVLSRRSFSIPGDLLSGNEFGLG